MKTASLGLLEVPVVRVNAGGDAPPDPPSVGDVTGPSLSLFSQEKIFGESRRMSGLIFLARVLRITRNHIKPQQTNGGLSSTCMHVRA